MKFGSEQNHGFSPEVISPEARSTFVQMYVALGGTDIQPLSEDQLLKAMKLRERTPRFVEAWEFGVRNHIFAVEQLFNLQMLHPFHQENYRKLEEVDPALPPI